MRSLFAAPVIGLASAFSVAAQGPLTPPGAPAPTMKTLEQVEPRIPLNDTTAPGDASSHFVINQAGSYYLTGNVTVSKLNGIRVAAADITIDLNGYTLRRASGDNGNGIDGAFAGLVVRNGTIRGFQNGIASGDELIGGAISQVTVTDCAIGITVGQGWRIEGVSAYENRSNGILTAGGSLVRNCVSRKNGGNGIFVGPGTTVAHCVVTLNNSHGIFAQDEVVVDSCTADDNTGHGIQVFNRATVRNCSANRNGDAASTAGSGINAAIRSLITGCTANRNRAHGIVVQGDSVVIGNRASENGQGGAGAAAAGIRTTGGGSRVEGNHVRDTIGAGILATTADVIVRNTSGGNSLAQFTPNSGDNFAPIQKPATASNPLANIDF